MSLRGQEAEDSDLLLRLSRGDEDAYRQLFQRHQSRAYAVALSLLRSTWDAEEVVAAAFLELWRKRDRVRIVDGSVLPWLLTVVSFQAKNHRRSTMRYRRLLANLPPVEHSPDHADEVARVVDAAGISKSVRAALAVLKPRDAAVLVLCVVEGLSITEAAIVLRVPEGTVKSRLSRAKARLRGHVAHALEISTKESNG